MKYGTVDPTVFMTFSLTVPLSFFLFPNMYAIIVFIADVAMLSIMLTVSHEIGSLINLSIFVIFQLVLGFSFFRLKMRLAERIVREQENAERDVLTGFANRRAYDRDMRSLAQEQPKDGLVYVAIDMNELKEVNDSHGHEAGDRLIVGAAECIRQCFGEKGRLYRVGGDEFAFILESAGSGLEQLLGDYEKAMAAWSGRNGMVLSTAYGYARREDHPDENITGLARMADRQMYEAKSEYYRRNGKDRRRYK